MESARDVLWPKKAKLISVMHTVYNVKNQPCWTIRVNFRKESDETEEEDIKERKKIEKDIETGNEDEESDDDNLSEETVLQGFTISPIFWWRLFQKASPFLLFSCKMVKLFGLVAMQTFFVKLYS